MTERDRFRHDRSPYERPSLGWRCGRAALWGTPCRGGPTAFGTCGGTAACRPDHSGGAWHCRRPPADGGPCTTGPGADGRCGVRQSPCIPRWALAAWRFRLSAVATAVALALVALFAVGSDMNAGRLSSVDPGPLSSAHAHFAADAGCSTCHVASGRGVGAWWQAFWSPAALAPAAAGEVASAHRLSAACVTCHGFAGHEWLAHNRVFEDRKDLGPTNCLMCHTEHRGRLASITTLTDAQCQTCHTRQIHDFASDHPAFHANFPYEHAQAIRFDHASHFAKHFTDPKVAKLVPAGGCVGCHIVDEGGRANRPAGFGKACAGCHQDGISARDFVAFRWPEIDNNTIKMSEVADRCGISGKALELLQAALAAAQKGEPAPPAKPAEAFSGVSADSPTALAAFLLGTGVDDAADYEGPVQDIARAMMSRGADPLVAAASVRLPNARPDRLFAGLDSEQVRRAACAWAVNEEYERPGKAVLPGWHAGSLDLRYTRPSHADPVLRAWIEAIAAAPVPADPDGATRFEAVRKEILSPSGGPGQCMKCHTTSGPAQGPLAVNWNVVLRAAEPHSRFDHHPHVDLLGPEKSCTSCHALADGTGSTAPSGLKPITLATCSSCHAPGKVRDDCQFCHVYHQDHALRKRMVSDAK